MRPSLFLYRMVSMAMLTIFLVLQIHVAGKYADVYGEEKAAQEVSEAADDSGAHFRELMGVAPLRCAIVLTKEPKSPKDIAYTKNGAKFIWRWQGDTSTMKHELAHLWLVFWVDGTEPPKVKRYGSALPDWLDEGFACLFEDDEARAHYRQGVRELMPLGDLFACIHPDSREKTDQPRAKDRWLFYAESASVVAYLAELGALGHVAVTLKSGKPMEAALGAKGLPKTLAEFETAWQTWLRRD